MPKANPKYVRPWRAGLLVAPLVIAFAGFTHGGGRAEAAPACTAALDSLASEWNAFGFAAPDKPTQMIVSGRHGYTTTGGQFNFMVQQMRAGARDCQSGDDETAMAHINAARNVLSRMRRT